MHVAANAGNNGGGIGGMLDGMATEQGFYATVAYQRLLDGRSFIYDMHDIELTPGKKVETSQNGGTDETKNRKKPKRKTIIKRSQNRSQEKDDKKNKNSKRDGKRIRRVKRSRQALPMLQKTVRADKNTSVCKENKHIHGKSSSTVKKKKQQQKRKRTKKRAKIPDGVLTEKTMCRS